MTEPTKAELQEWRANKVTAALFRDIEEAIQAAKEQPRMYDGVDRSALRNAHTGGLIEGYEELAEWYENKIGELDED